MLVVEPNPILALDVEETLLRNGAAIVEVAHSAGEAIECLDGALLDAALLDLNLADGAALRVAARLATRGIPFLFGATYGGRDAPPAPFEDRLVVGKPYSEPYLLSRLATLLGQR